MSKQRFEEHIDQSGRDLDVIELELDKEDSPEQR